jgi:hypothetical protein
MSHEYHNYITLRAPLAERMALIITALAQPGWEWVAVHVEGADDKETDTVHRGRDSGVSKLDFYSRGHPGRGIQELTTKHPTVKMECEHSDLDEGNAEWTDVLNCQILREKAILDIFGELGEPVEGEWEYTDEGRRVEALEAAREKEIEAAFLEELEKSNEGVDALEEHLSALANDTAKGEE